MLLRCSLPGCRSRWIIAFDARFAFYNWIICNIIISRRPTNEIAKGNRGEVAATQLMSGQLNNWLRSTRERAAPNERGPLNCIRSQLPLLFPSSSIMQSTSSADAKTITPFLDQTIALPLLSNSKTLSSANSPSMIYGVLNWQTRRDSEYSLSSFIFHLPFGLNSVHCAPNEPRSTLELLPLPAEALQIPPRLPLGSSTRVILAPRES